MAATAADIVKAYGVPSNKAGALGVSKDFANAIVKVSQQVGIADPAILANVIYFESGYTFNPATTNWMGATGLIQFTKGTAGELGTTTAHLASLSQVGQMEYVRKYFMLRRVKKGCARASGCDYNAPDRFYPSRPLDREGTYMAIFYPPAVGKSKYWPFPPSVLATNPGTANPLTYAMSADKYAKLAVVTRFVPVAVAGSLGALMLGSGFLWWLSLRREGK